MPCCQYIYFTAGTKAGCLYLPGFLVSIVEWIGPSYIFQLRCFYAEKMVLLATCIQHIGYYDSRFDVGCQLKYYKCLYYLAHSVGLPGDIALYGDDVL